MAEGTFMTDIQQRAPQVARSTTSGIAVLQARAGSRRATGFAVTAAVGGFLFGFDTSVVNGAVGAIGRTYGTGAFTTGFVVAAALLGSAAGAWFAGRLADRIGRIRVMLLAAALFAVSAIASALAISALELAAWRVVGGIAVGAASVIAPAYIAEISPAAVRGRLGSLQQMAIVLGIFAALLSDTVLAGIAGDATNPLWLGLGAWRWMFMVTAVPSVLYGLFALRLPESPRFLLRTHRLAEARNVLQMTLPANKVENRLAEIAATLSDEHPTRLAELRGRRLGLMPVVWVGILLSVVQQFVGINVIFYYSTTLWQSVGFNTADSFRISVFTSVVNVVVTIVAIATIDRIGRKPLLVIGSAGMTVTLAALAVLFTTAPVINGTPDLSGGAGALALVAANLFVVFFGMSWGPVVWVLLGEIFDNRTRAIALAVAASAQWLANFVVTLTFPPLSGVNVGLPYLLYAVAAALSLLFVLHAVQETKGRELEDMQSAPLIMPAHR
jgi:sugar porter (SP) family MFS transporter